MKLVPFVDELSGASNLDPGNKCSKTSYHLIRLLLQITCMYTELFYNYYLFCTKTLLLSAFLEFTGSISCVALYVTRLALQRILLACFQVLLPPYFFFSP